MPKNTGNVIDNLIRIRSHIDASRSQTLPGFEIVGVYEEELAIPAVEMYSVPIDPASLNGCEACQ